MVKYNKFLIANENLMVAIYHVAFLAEFEFRFLKLNSYFTLDCNVVSFIEIIF